MENVDFQNIETFFIASASQMEKTLPRMIARKKRWNSQSDFEGLYSMTAILPPIAVSRVMVRGAWTAEVATASIDHKPLRERAIP